MLKKDYLCEVSGRDHFEPTGDIFVTWKHVGVWARTHGIFSKQKIKNGKPYPPIFCRI